jgi:hypothetical protein
VKVNLREVKVPFSREHSNLEEERGLGFQSLCSKTTLSVFHIVSQETGGKDGMEV